MPSAALSSRRSTSTGFTFLPGGGLTWEIPSLEGPTEAKQIVGVIIAVKTPRAYWRESFDETGGGVPPDCSADDGIVGIGDPGGDCARCPLARFGSDARGRGQACKQMYMLFVLRHDSLLPMVITAPPTSFIVIRKYLLRLASNMKRCHQVESSFKLQKERNKDGITYAAIVPSLLRMLADAEATKMAEIAKAMAPHFSQMRPALDTPIE